MMSESCLPSELDIGLLTHLIIRINDKEKVLFKNNMASNVKHFKMVDLFYFLKT